MFKVFYMLFEPLFTKKKMMALVVMSFLAVTANADEFTGTVRGLSVNSSSQVWVRLVNGTLVPNCVGSTWSFQFGLTTEAGRQWSAMLLAAKVANRSVKIVYTASTTGLCTVSSVYFYD